MPFVYQSRELSCQPVKTYADLLGAVSTAVTLFSEDEAIKEFYDWLLGLPACHETNEDDIVDIEKDIEYVSFPQEDSPEVQTGIDEILQKGYYQAYFVAKKLWVFSVHGLLLLCQNKDDLQLATVPLWYPQFAPAHIVGSLCWLAGVCNYVYEVAPNVIIAMEGKYPYRKIKLISAIGASDEHLEFVEKIKNKMKCSLELPHNTSFLVFADGNATVRDRSSDSNYNSYLV